MTTTAHHITCPVHNTTPLDHYTDGVWWCHSCGLEYVVSVSRAYPTDLAGAGVVNPLAPFHQLVLDIDDLFRNEPCPTTRSARKRRARLEQQHAA